jgi:hypothetical protein
MNILQQSMPVTNYTVIDIPTCLMQGFRDKYHKDEFHKLNKYWSNQHESGKYNKYGQHGDHYDNHEEKSDKGGKHKVSDLYSFLHHTSE